VLCCVIAKISKKTAIRNLYDAYESLLQNFNTASAKSKIATKLNSKQKKLFDTVIKEGQEDEQ